MSAPENMNAEHALNDKLLSIKHRLREVCGAVCGPVPPRPMQATLNGTVAPAPAPADPDFLSQLFSLQSANHDVADELMNAVIHLENSFGIGKDVAAAPDAAYSQARR